MKTLIRGTKILDESSCSCNTGLIDGIEIVTRIIEGYGIAISSTGITPGTGNVTVCVDPNVIVGVGSKVKADDTDPTPGYLCEKIDNITIVEDNSQHFICIGDGSLTSDKFCYEDVCCFIEDTVINSCCVCEYTENVIQNSQVINNFLEDFVTCEVTTNPTICDFIYCASSDYMVKVGECDCCHYLNSKFFDYISCPVNPNDGCIIHTLGETTSGIFKNGYLDLDSSDRIADDFDDFNYLFKFLLPPMPEPMSQALPFNVITYAGYISNSNLPLGNLNPGDYFTRIINVSSATATTLNSCRFDYADRGCLSLYKNGTEVDNFDMGSCFNENEREGYQSYPPAQSTNGCITVLCVGWYNDFPVFQKGCACIDVTFEEGCQNYQFFHCVDPSNIQSSFVYDFFYDNGQDPNVVSIGADLGTYPEVVSYLSGIKYYTMGQQIDIVDVCILNIFDRTYVEKPVIIGGDVINDMEFSWNDTRATGYNDPPNWDDQWIFNGTFEINVANVITNSPEFYVTARDTFSNTDSKSITKIYWLINTYSQKSDDLHEYFVDEVYRMPRPVDNYDNIPSHIKFLWDSQQALQDGDLQLYLGKLVYPKFNFNDTAWFKPVQEAGRDYSNFSSNGEYYRAFYKNYPHNSGTINIDGITLNDLGSKLNIFMKLPSQTGWLDLSQPFNVATFTGADGDGNRVSYSQIGSVLQINWTSGTFSTTNSGYMYIIKVVYNANTDVEIDRIYETGW